MKQQKSKQTNTLWGTILLLVLFVLLPILLLLGSVDTYTSLHDGTKTFESLERRKYDPVQSEVMFSAVFIAAAALAIYAKIRKNGWLLALVGVLVWVLFTVWSYWYTHLSLVWGLERIGMILSITSFLIYVVYYFTKKKKTAPKKRKKA